MVVLPGVEVELLDISATTASKSMSAILLCCKECTGQPYLRDESIGGWCAQTRTPQTVSNGKINASNISANHPNSTSGVVGNVPRTKTKPFAVPACVMNFCVAFFLSSLVRNRNRRPR